MSEIQSRTAARRRRAVALLAVAAALGSTAGPGSETASAQGQGQRPNVVVIMTDDQTVDDLAAMPATRRAFVGRGVTFRNSTVSYPVCCPSRAT
jgi:hypothetical protein